MTLLIKKEPDQPPDIDGLVLIDCWDPDPYQADQYNLFYEKLLPELGRFDFRCIVNACYNVKLDCNDPSIKNTMEQYCWEDSDRFQTSNYTLIYNLIHRCRATNQTSPMFTKTILDNDRSLMLLEFDDFVFHWKYALDRKINNWLVVGKDWQSCLHGRPIGFASMKYCKEDDLNFYATDFGCSLGNHETAQRIHFENDRMRWQEIPNFGYKLVKQNPRKL
jgi:hypothetical protein